MTQNYPILEITGDVDGDGSAETGIFEIPQARVEPLTLTEFLAQFGGGGGLTGALTAQVIGKGDQVAIDAGAGPRTFEITFTGWTDSTDYQWGDDPAATLTDSSATGQDRLSQVSIINEWLTQVDIGSNSPATLYWGEYSESTSFADSGVLDPLRVAIPESSFPVEHDETTSTFQGSLTCISVEDVSDIIDGVNIPG